MTHSYRSHVYALAIATAALLLAALFLLTRPQKLRRLSMPQRGIIAVSAFLVGFSPVLGLSGEAYRWYEAWPIWVVAVVIVGFIEYRLFAPAALRSNKPQTGADQSDIGE